MAPKQENKIFRHDDVIPEFTEKHVMFSYLTALKGNFLVFSRTKHLMYEILVKERQNTRSFPVASGNRRPHLPSRRLQWRHPIHPRIILNFCVFCVLLRPQKESNEINGVSNARTRVPGTMARGPATIRIRRMNAGSRADPSEEYMHGSREPEM